MWISWKRSYPGPGGLFRNDSLGEPGLQGVSLLASFMGKADGLLAWMDDRLERRRSRVKRDGLLAVLLLAPALTLLGVFGFVPLLTGFYMSLFGGRYGEDRFVGLGNYLRAYGDPAFWNSLRVTAYYVIGAIPASLAISFFAAYGLHRILRGRGLFRTLYFLPYVTSAVAGAMVWRAIFSTPEGMANLFLQGLGLGPQRWILEDRGVLHLLSGGFIPEQVGPSLALCCVILFDVWHDTGFMVVVFLAGLTSIPRELEESARIDGAGAWRVIRNVVLPLLSPTILFLTVASTIKAFQAFNSFYALTQRPDQPLFEPTTNLVIYIYGQLYRWNDYGYGAALAILFTLAIVLVTALQWRYVGRRVHYS